LSKLVADVVTGEPEIRSTGKGKGYRQADEDEKLQQQFGANAISAHFK
jgi:hypothetical protein